MIKYFIAFIAVFWIHVSTFGITSTCPTYIKIEIDSNHKLQDTLYVFWKGGYSFVSTHLKNIETATKDKNGRYLFKICTQGYSFGYFYLAEKNSTISNTFYKSLTNVYYFSSGDSLHMIFHKNTNSKYNFQVYSDMYYIFEGRGSLKYNIGNSCDSIYLNPSVLKKGGSELQDQFGDRFTQKRAECMLLLNSQKRYLSENDYQRIKAYILFERSSERFHFIRDYFNNNVNVMNRDSVLTSFNRYILTLMEQDIKKEILENCPTYIVFLYNYLKFTAHLQSEDDEAKTVYDMIKKNYHGYVKDRLITLLLLEGVKSNSIPTIVQEALKTINDTSCLSLVYRIAASMPGQKFPTFKLQDTNGKYLTNENFKNLVLVVDFWFTGCLACSNYYQKVLSAVEIHFKNHPKIKFLSISVDVDRNRWKTSIASGRYTSLECYNAYTEGKGSNHTILSDLGIEAFPTLLIIDRKGYINNVNTIDLRSSQEFIKVLSRILNEG